MAILEKPLPAIFMDYRLSAPAAIAGCLALACMFAACWYVTRGMGGQLEFLGILCSAAATKVVLGFSLAFQVSGERTSIFLAFTLIFASFVFGSANVVIDIPSTIAIANSMAKTFFIFFILFFLSFSGIAYDLRFLLPFGALCACVVRPGGR